ncbi:MAG: rhombosortase [Candidatus Thiodiazotropha sp.]
MRAESIPWRLLCPLLFSLACLLIAVLPETLIATLHYHRGAIFEGELWRLISAHMTHLGWGHLSMNLVGLWFILYLFPAIQQPMRCLTLLTLLMLGTSAGLWLFSPDVSWYRGLSGILHGLLCWGVLSQLRNQPRVSLSILILIVLKLLWEQWQGPLPGSESMADGSVIVDAHLYGAVSGGILWGLWSIYTGIAKTPTHN